MRAEWTVTDSPRRSRPLVDAGAPDDVLKVDDAHHGTLALL